MELMNKQKTITMLEKMKVKDPFDRYMKQNIGLDLAIDAIQTAPIIQLCGDTISRQQAIDALMKRDKELRNINWYDKPFAESECKGIDCALEIINALPSAQPERRCVNCGRTVNNGGWYEDGRTRCPIEEHYALPKDGYCHLWEKRKDWEDDYVKRAEEGEK